MDPWEQGRDYFAEGKLAMVITDFQDLDKVEKAGINYGTTGTKYFATDTPSTIYVDLSAAIANPIPPGSTPLQ